MADRSPSGLPESPRAGLPVWGKVLLTSLAVAALAGAGQLGIAYGLGIVQLARRFDAAAPDEWNAQLTWIGWFAIVATLIGGYAGHRIAIARRLRARTGARIGLAAVAGVGAAIVAPLTMIPARDARLYATLDAVLVTGLTTVFGAAAGILFTAVALSHWVVRWNAALIAGAAWLVALVSAAPSLGPNDPPPHIRLGVLDAAGIAAGTTQRLALVGMPAIALLAGAVAGELARSRGRDTLQIALAGVAGPALLGVAYVIAGPGSGGVKSQAPPYWGALIAVAAGALGSILAAVLRPKDAASPAPGGDAPQVPPGSSSSKPDSDRAGASGAGRGTGNVYVSGSHRDEAPGAGGPGTGGPGTGGPGTGGEDAGRKGGRRRRDRGEDASGSAAVPGVTPATVDGQGGGRPGLTGTLAARPAGGPPAPMTAPVAAALPAALPAQRRDSHDPAAREAPAQERPPAGQPKPAPGRDGAAAKVPAPRQAKPGRAAKQSPAAGERIPTRDAEYVDWVSGLGTDR